MAFVGFIECSYFSIPVESIKNANNAAETDDNLNSNKTWQESGM